MKYSLLKSEISQEAYDGLHDWQIADLLNTKTVTTPRVEFFISARTLLAVIGVVKTEAVMGYLKENAPTVQSIMLQTGSNDGSRGGLDIANPSTQAFINSLVPTLITTHEATAIIALANEEKLWRLTIGFMGEITPGDVRIALEDRF